jgi:hypothetical protein
MSNAENQNGREANKRMLDFIRKNEPVTKTQIQSHFPSNGILTLRKLMNNKEVKYNSRFQIVTDE